MATQFSSAALELAELLKEKKNYTFRLSIYLIEGLKRYCKAENKSIAVELEKAVLDQIGQSIQKHSAKVEKNIDGFIEKKKEQEKKRRVKYLKKKQRKK